MDGWKHVRTAVLESMSPRTVRRHVSNVLPVNTLYPRENRNVTCVPPENTVSSRKVVQCVKSVVKVALFVRTEHRYVLSVIRESTCSVRALKSYHFLILSLKYTKAEMHTPTIQTGTQQRKE